MTTRTVQSHQKSQPVTEGAGVHLHRAFGSQRQAVDYDPFLLFDDFRGDRPDQFTAGFPWHPHRGIETITYMLDGYVEHGDSLGNRGVVKSGEVQWMTAGSGIVHQEMPKPSERGSMGGFQLWANLPSHCKMIPPRYQDYGSEVFPVVQCDDKTRVTLICGNMLDARGPVDAIAVTPGLFDVTIDANHQARLPVPQGNTVLAYIFEGSGFFEEDCIQLHDNRSMLRFHDNGEDVLVTTLKDQGVRFLLIYGKPIKESVAWRGPIVMNTQDELDEAYRELKDGTFLKQA